MKYKNVKSVLHSQEKSLDPSEKLCTHKTKFHTDSTHMKTRALKVMPKNRVKTRYRSRTPPMGLSLYYINLVLL